MSNFIMTQSGNRFYFDNMETNNINILDIAHALSNICRFNGHTPTHYSVAKHSVLVATLLPDRLKLAGLLHDATEAYMGDVTRPLKRELEAYKAKEDQLHRIIENLFNIVLNDEDRKLIKKADNEALYHEVRFFFPEQNIEEWGIEIFPESEEAISWIDIMGQMDTPVNFFLKVYDQCYEMNKKDF